MYRLLAALTKLLVSIFFTNHDFYRSANYVCICICIGFLQLLRNFWFLYSLQITIFIGLQIRLDM